MAKKHFKINRQDYGRVLVTETLPYETPVIFSNSGIYEQLKYRGESDSIRAIFLGALVTGESEVRRIPNTIPLRYKIRKNSKEFRRLSLTHPGAQWQMKEFYERYENLILHHCSLSPASIRAPDRVAGSFFKRNTWENLNQYKVDAVSTNDLEELTKHSPSYFSYRGHDRLYKFYESRDYYELERRFENLWTLDVSKCFDSIYTHCFSWATKDKEFTKSNLNERTFGGEFDALMRFANHGETNGIVIGPEISRVFAEIIFQRIDVDAIEILEHRYERLWNKDYTIRRYVDDVFIFARSIEIAANVYEAYADVLAGFNLYANTAKSTRIQRPFVTSKSRLIHQASREANDFIDKFLVAAQGVRRLEPARIWSKWRITRDFLASVKSLCSSNNVTYDDLSSYLISILNERVKRLIDVHKSGVKIEEAENYTSAVLVLLEIMYFLYDVSPAVSSSYKLCASIILCMRFARQFLPAQAETIYQRIYELTLQHLATERKSSARNVEGFLPLETLNVLLCVRELGDNYLIPESVIKSIFVDKADYSYFEIVCCLFYIKDNIEYAELRDFFLEMTYKKLSNLSDVRIDSEKAYLLLDMLCCPYVPLAKKREWVRSAFTAFELPAPGKTVILEFIQDFSSKSWQIDWNAVDLLSLLERKELKRAY